MAVMRSEIVRRDFKTVCDKVDNGDVVTVMRLRQDGNVVILSEARFSQLEKVEIYNVIYFSRFSIKIGDLLFSTPNKNIKSA